MDQTEVFEEIYKDYLTQIQGLDLKRVASRLGVEVDGDSVIVPFLGARYRISSREILDPAGKRPPHSVCVILAKYLLMCPDEEPSETQWVTYREFKDAAPFVAGFHGHAERPIGEGFAGKMEELVDTAKKLGGERIETEVRADLSIRFQALPKVPILLLFNDQDEDFPAQCSILFERRAQRYLDMECLAMMGWLLASLLRAKAKAAGAAF